MGPHGSPSGPKGGSNSVETFDQERERSVWRSGATGPIQASPEERLDAQQALVRYDSLADEKLRTKFLAQILPSNPKVSREGGLAARGRPKMHPRGPVGRHGALDL